MRNKRFFPESRRLAAPLLCVFLLTAGTAALPALHSHDHDTVGHHGNGLAPVEHSCAFCELLSTLRAAEPGLSPTSLFTKSVSENSAFPLFPGPAIPPEHLPLSSRAPPVR